MSTRSRVTLMAIALCSASIVAAQTPDARSAGAKPAKAGPPSPSPGPAPTAIPAPGPARDPGAAAVGQPARGETTVATEPVETLEEIVARVRKRLAIETAARPQRSTRAAQPQAAPARVKLVWRPTVTWPPELRGQATGAPSERVDVTWGELP